MAAFRLLWRTIFGVTLAQFVQLSGGTFADVRRDV